MLLLLMLLLKVDHVKNVLEETLSFMYVEADTRMYNLQVLPLPS